MKWKYLISQIFLEKYKTVTLTKLLTSVIVESLNTTLLIMHENESKANCR